MRSKMNAGKESTKRKIVKRKTTKRMNRKWTADEISQILQFIQKERNFEKPTAKLYYTKCLNKTKIDVTWSLIRWKVRYLRTTFKKANDWRKSTGNGLLETDQGIVRFKSELKRICPYYEILQDIFSEKTNTLSYEIHDSDTTCSPFLLPDSKAIVSLKIENDALDIDPPLSITVDSSYLLEPLNTFETLTTTTSEANTSLDQVLSTERDDLQRIKLDLEYKKMNKELEISERKLQLKEMKLAEAIERRKEEMDIRRRKIDLKRMEIEKDDQLRRLEIAIQEKVEKYEIEMRYKYAK